MASQVNLPGLQDLLDGTKPWAAGSDPRGILVMTNSTTNSENNIANTAAYATLDEFDGSGYGRIAITGEAVNVLSGQGRVALACADTEYGVLQNGTRPVMGQLVHFHDGAGDAASVPLVFIQFNVNVNPEGLELTVEYDTDGAVLFG